MATLESAKERGRELVGLGEAGRVQRMEIDPDEYAEFLQWKARKKQGAAIPVLVKDFLAAKEEQGVARVTLRELTGSLTDFAKTFSGSITDLTRKEVEAWLNARQVGNRRWNNIRAAIRALHHFARRDGLLPVEMMPVEKIAKKRAPVKVETYTPEEMERLVQSVPQEFLPHVVIGGFCGCRAEEVTPYAWNSSKPGLRWENILWDKGKIDVPAEVSKVRQRRFAALTDAAAAFLAPWKGKRGPVVETWPHFRKVREWYKAAEVVPKANGLRHSFASYRLALTKDAPALALEMGNSPGMIFRHYLDLKHEDEAERWFALRP